MISSTAWELLITAAVTELGDNSFSMGTSIGVKLTESICHGLSHRSTDTYAKLRIISHKVWPQLFNKPLHEVQSPSSSCVIWETQDLVWLQRLPSRGDKPVPLAMSISHLFVGIIQGAMDALEIKGSVTSRLDIMPLFQLVLDISE
ncbi:hypothetical protein P9112_009172 [Eukaryota sp. TZLM1-RC]